MQRTLSLLLLLLWTIVTVVSALHLEHTILSRKSLLEAAASSQLLASSGGSGRLVLSSTASRGDVASKDARNPSTEYASAGSDSGGGSTLSLPPLSQSSSSTWLDETLTTSIGKSYIRPAALNYRPKNSGRLGNGLDSSEIYYPPFMFGSWKVTATLLRTVVNDNVAVPVSSQISPWLVAWSGGAAAGTSKEPMIPTACTTTFEQHYFSTLANTWQNQVTVNLGLGVPTPKVIADRAYNARAVTTAYYQPFNDENGLLQSVSWDYRNNPTKLVLDYKGGDKSRILANVAIVSRQSEVATRIVADDTFATYEHLQTTTSGGQSRSSGSSTTTTMDTQVTTEFQRVSDDVVNAVCRVAVFGAKLSKSSTFNGLSSTSMATADYGCDYHWTMQRILTDFTVNTRTAEADDDDDVVNTRRRPCVTTPNDFVQCF